MRVAYIDEAGCTGMLPTATSSVQPVFVVAGIDFQRQDLRSVTQDFLGLKLHMYPSLRGSGRLNVVLRELKGADLRRDIARGSKRERRHALTFLGKVVGLLEQYGAILYGRVWVKQIGIPVRHTAIYTFSMQNICESFEHALAQRDVPGIVIADSRRKGQNTSVSHSIFTQKFKAGGDQYPHIVDMPTFGHSENHVGIQIADLICSALLFPMATYSYCAGLINSIHVQPGFSVIKTQFGRRLDRLQEPYYDRGKWRGGVVVSDPLGSKRSDVLFR